MGQTELTAAVLADTPLVFYKCDEASGLLQDSSGNATHMTASRGSASYQAGAPFTGAQSISMGDDVGFSIASVITSTTTTYSYEFWAKGIFGQNPLAFTVGRAGYTYINGWGWQNGNRPSGLGGLSLSVDNFMHVAVTYASSTLRIYFNGDLWASGTPSVPTTPTLYTQVGAGDATDDNAGSGIILSNLSIYTTQLSDARITAHYNAAIDWQSRTLRTVRSPQPLARR